VVTVSARSPCIRPARFIIRRSSSVQFLLERSVAVVRGKRALGTGFLMEPGLLATNAPVVEGEIIKHLEIRFPSAGNDRN
jgi:hypothetical protein